MDAVKGALKEDEAVEKVWRRMAELSMNHEKILDFVDKLVPEREWAKSIKKGLVESKKLEMTSLKNKILGLGTVIDIRELNNLDWFLLTALNEAVDLYINTDGKTLEILPADPDD